MKKKIFIIIPILVLLIVILVIVFTKYKKNNEVLMEAHRGIIYREVGYDACLSFYDDDVYSLYDCDSEPTDYPFDSEWECEYFFDNKEETITFPSVLSFWIMMFLLSNVNIDYLSNNFSPCLDIWSSNDRAI